MFEIRLEPSGLRFAAPVGLPLLAAARRAGIVLPSSCRNGTCRSCISRLVEGAVSYRIEWPGLLAEEKREGWILPCVAHPAADLVIEAPNARADALSPPPAPVAPAAP
ncbi:2Fe-2S iron-sulfur cluster-binding protein [Caldimonas sp. KR1-144]|uniref:2Fe-2S iron-sulfur cluster-binding protein n=1 Tax=Caldimonas sp. KR1-144 TaxID=3400911 RepID=UPI003C093D85